MENNQLFSAILAEIYKEIKFDKELSFLKFLDHGKIAGIIVSKSFNKLSLQQRQNQIWEILNKKIPLVYLNQISNIFTFTLNEFLSDEMLNLTLEDVMEEEF